MSLINELLRKNLSTESAVDDSKIGGGPDATAAQPAPEIGSAFEEEAHGTKHDTPGAETVTTAAGEEVPAAAAEPQEPTQPETTADADTATGESTGADTGTDPTATAQEPATPDAATEADATAAVTETETQASSEEPQNEPASETNDNSSDDGLGSTDGSSDTSNEPAAENAGSDESDAGAGAEADSSDSEAGSSEPQPDTENPDNLDPVKELPNPEEESDLKPEVQEAESEGEDAEIAPDTETDDELAEKADLVAGYADAKQSLEEIVETITDSLADGGLTPEGMASAQGATNDVLSSIGEAEMGLPSAESLQTLIGRRENTKLVLESITEKAKAIGKKIWQALMELFDRIVKAFSNRRANAKKVPEEVVEAAIERVKHNRTKVDRHSPTSPTGKITAAVAGRIGVIKGVTKLDVRSITELFLSFQKDAEVAMKWLRDMARVYGNLDHIDPETVMPDVIDQDRYTSVYGSNSLTIDDYDNELDASALLALHEFAAKHQSSANKLFDEFYDMVDDLRKKNIQMKNGENPALVPFAKNVTTGLRQVSNIVARYESALFNLDGFIVHVSKLK